MLTDQTLQEIENRFNASTQTKWTGSGNLPFNATLDKPAPSLSKHDSKQPHYWRVQDVEFVLWAHNHDVPELLKEVKRLRRLTTSFEQPVDISLGAPDGTPCDGRVIPRTDLRVK